MDVPMKVLLAHDVAVDGDRPWQRVLRLLQALWREERGLPIGEHTNRNGETRQLGSRIAMPVAEQELGNYLTEDIRGVVRRELDSEDARATGKLYSKPRIYNDLLSSQPLCFNLFGELEAQGDYQLATSVARHLWPDRVDRITRIALEHSPGREDDTYTGNKTAFDVYLEHSRPDGGRGFIGIEVKYHENLVVKKAENRPRTDEVAAGSGVFVPDQLERLRKPPLQQVWFDHLLALSMLEPDGWDSALFVFLHPTANERCYRVVGDYESTLTDTSTFQRLTLEEFVAAVGLHTDAQWVRDLHHRYLDYDRVQAAGMTT